MAELITNKQWPSYQLTALIYYVYLLVRIMMDDSQLADYSLEQGGVYNLLVARDLETN